MVKYRKLFTGCGVAIISCVMWLVSACSQPVNNGDQVATTVAKPPPLSNSTTTEPSTLSNSTTVISPTTTTEPPTASNSTMDTPTTTTTPPVVSTPTPTEGQTTPADIDSYVLYINGLVNNPQTLSYAQILALPSVTQNVEISCPDVIDETDQWTGVPVSTLLKAAGLTPGASEITFTGADGFYVELPLNAVLDSNTFLAYQMNGQALSQDRGYPLRLVVGGYSGGDWLRWVTNIEVKPALMSFSDHSAIIQKLSSNIPKSGSKLCSCLLSATVTKYQVVEEKETERDQNDSLSNQSSL